MLLPLCHQRDPSHLYDYFFQLLIRTQIVTATRRLDTPKALANVSPGLERSDNPGATNGQGIKR
jgi:hypothetical protein